MIGHCLGAAGGLEAIATIKAITTGWVHPSINQFVRILFFLFGLGLFVSMLGSTKAWTSLIAEHFILFILLMWVIFLVSFLNS